MSFEAIIICLSLYKFSANMNKSVILFIITSVILSASCTSRKQAVSNTADVKDSTTMVVNRYQPVYNPSATMVNDLIHTRLEVSFDWLNRQLLGKATLTFEPYAYPTDSLILDAKAMDIKSVALVQDGKQLPLNYKYDNWSLRIKLPKTYVRKERYVVFIDYVANPERVEQGGSDAITEAKGLYFINHDGSDPKKHQEIWTQGETESSSTWFPTIDKPNEKTTQEIYITVDDRFTTLSNGLLMSTAKNGDGTRTDYWKMDLPHAPYLFMMTVGEFAIVKDSWKRKDGKEIEVSYYVEKQFEEHARAIFGKTPKMLTYFSDLLGVEYPWPKYSQVVVRDYVSGAMENTSATIHGDFLYKTTRELIDEDNESIIAHELFHHWFGDLVTCESWANLPLNESFANYSQYLWDEFEYGPMEAAKNAYSEMEGYFLSAEQGGHVDMIRFDYADKEEMFDGHSYNKGGRILHMLRTYLGDEVFFEALKNYLIKNAYTATEIHELRMQFEKASGKDLNWFFNQWFLASGHPIVTINQAYNSSTKQLKLSINQKQNLDEWPLYQLPLFVDIYVNGEVQRELIWLKNEKDTFEFAVNAVPDLVNVDATKTTLWKKTDKKSTQQWIYQLNVAPLWLDKKEAFDVLGKSSEEAAIYAIIKALDHEFYDVKLMAMKNLSNAKAKFPNEVRNKLIDLSKNDKHPKVRAEAIKTLTKYFKDFNGLDELLSNALNDESYAVMSAGLNGYAATQGEKGLSMAKKYENVENASINSAVASIYAEYGGADEHNFFIRNVKELNGTNRYFFLQQYYKFVIRQTDEEAAKSIPVFESQITEDNMWFVKLGGYQLLGGLQSHYGKRINELDNKLMSLQKANASAEEVASFEKQKNFCVAREQEIAQKIKFLRENEKDSNVLKYLPKVIE
jgi:aminopeptidase N